MTERSSRIRELFDGALDLPREERATYLDTACGDDAELRRRVQSLLDAHDRAEGFLEGNVAGLAGEIEPIVAGAFVGSYRIVRKIGEGGMGLVFEAEQREPHRAVALKVIRGGAFVSEETVRMFRREAQTLARLRHPGIGAIYEAGRTEDGRHFFAMELVRGETLDAWLDARRRPLRDEDELRLRLGLFVRICDAVQYAHQNGVIHRDLKPSNILILPSKGNEDPPEIKILDFGLARITDVDVAVTTVHSVAGRIQGTLPYMSPEQTRGRPDEVDTRSDVYTLGVLLYRMLTGIVPIAIDGLTLLESIRAIEERAPRSLRSALPGGAPRLQELEAIVRKALEKAPSRRYPGAAALAEDVLRFLANQPVLARVPSAAYQLRKMIARHRVPFAFAAVLLFVLTTFAVTATYQARRIARDAASARRVAGYLAALFESGGPGVLAEPGPGVREILDRGAAEIRKAFEKDPLSYGRLAGNLGAAYMSGGAFRQAGPFLEESHATLADVLGSAHPETAAAAGRLARHRHAMGRYEEAETLYREALAGEGSPAAAAGILAAMGAVARSRDDLAGAEARYRETLSLLASETDRASAALRVRASEGLADALYASGEHAEAVAAGRDAVARAEETLGASTPVVGRLLAELSLYYLAEGRPEEAVRAAARALDVAGDALAGPSPDLANVLRILALLGDTRLRAAGTGDRWSEVVGRLDALLDAPTDGAREVLESRDESDEIALARLLSVQGRVLTTDQPFAASTLESLAAIYAAGGRKDESRALYRRCAEIRARHLGSEHPDAVRAARLAKE